jgi:hypothetical protein
LPGDMPGMNRRVESPENVTNPKTKNPRTPTPNNCKKNTVAPTCPGNELPGYFRLSLRDSFLHIMAFLRKAAEYPYPVVSVANQHDGRHNETVNS